MASGSAAFAGGKLAGSGCLTTSAESPLLRWDSMFPLMLRNVLLQSSDFAILLGHIWFAQSRMQFEQLRIGMAAPICSECCCRCSWALTHTQQPCRRNCMAFKPSCGPRTLQRTSVYRAESRCVHACRNDAHTCKNFCVFALFIQNNRN